MSTPKDLIGAPQPRSHWPFTAGNERLYYGAREAGGIRQGHHDAAAFIVDHLERMRRCKTTVTQLAHEVLEAKRKDGRAPMYLSDLRKRLARFCQSFGERPIASITVEEADNWLRDLPLSPKSSANFRANIGVMFSHAERRRMLDSNPVTHTAKPKLPNNPPEIFTVGELRVLLELQAALLRTCYLCLRLAHSRDCAMRRLSGLIGVRLIFNAGTLR
jgi:hypothetical protein